MTRLIALAAFLTAAPAWAEDLTVSGFYPSRIGAYRSLTTTGETSLAYGGGAVGVGIEDPAAGTLVHVRTADAALRIETAGVGACELRVSDDGTGKKMFSLRDSDAGADRLVINAAGNVSIGTVPQANPLAVKGGHAISLQGGVRSELTFVPEPLEPGIDRWVVGARGGEFVVRAEGSGPKPGLVITHEGNFYFGAGVTALGGGPQSGRKIDTDTGGYLDGGNWKTHSSRASKQDIEPLRSAEAVEALEGLQPVNFRYKVTPEDPQIGFIAEDVPELVAAAGRRTLSALDIVAVLTKIVQEQEKDIQELEQLLEAKTR